MKEYKLAKGWAVFIYIAAPILVALFCYLLLLPFQDNEAAAKAGWFMIPLALVMIAVMVIGIIDAYKGRFIIQADRMTSVGALSTRELRFDEVKGYRVNDKYIFVEPVEKGRKRIKISQYTGGYNEILYWLSQRFPDLDVQSAKEEEKIMLDDERLGWSKEERELRLVKARKICKVLNLMALVAALWAMFYPTPYQLSMAVVLVLPVAGLVVSRLFRGMVRIDEKKGSAYPSVLYAILLPAAALVLRALLDYDIFDYSNVWLPTGIITAVFLLLLFFKQREFLFNSTQDYWSALVVGLFLLGYGYGAVIHINCYYDRSAPQHFTAEVLEKSMSTGKTTSYYLDLSAWGPQTEPDEASVGSDLYNRTAVGDSVNIYFRKGKLAVPWFVVTDE